MEYNETTMVQYMIYIYTMVLHIIITQDYIKKYHATMVFGHVPWYYHGILRTTMAILYHSTWHYFQCHGI